MVNKNDPNVRKLNRIIEECGLNNSKINTLKECSPSMFVVITEKIFATKVANVIRNPNHSKHHVSNMRAVLNFLRKQIHLNDRYEVFDYYPERNEKALQYLISVFEKLVKAAILRSTSKALLSDDEGDDVSYDQSTESSLKTKKDQILSDLSSELTDPSVRFGTNRKGDVQSLSDDLSFATPSSFERILKKEAGIKNKKRKLKKKKAPETIPVTIQPLTEEVLREINQNLVEERKALSEQSLNAQLQRQDDDYHESAKLLAEIERKTKALYDEVNHIHVDEENYPDDWIIQGDDESKPIRHGNPLLAQDYDSEPNSESDSDIDDDELEEEDRLIDKLMKDTLKDIPNRSKVEEQEEEDNYHQSRQSIFENIDRQSPCQYNIEDPETELSRKMRRQTLSDLKTELDESVALDDTISQSLLKRKMRPRSSKPYTAKYDRTANETEKTIENLKRSLSSRPHSASYTRRVGSSRLPQQQNTKRKEKKDIPTREKSSKISSKVNESLSILNNRPDKRSSSVIKKKSKKTKKQRKHSKKRSKSTSRKVIRRNSTTATSNSQMLPPQSDKYKMLYMRFLNDYLTGKSQVKPSIAVRNYLRDEKINVLRERREIEDEERAFKSANRWKEDLEERVARRQSRKWNRLKMETARDERIRARLAEKRKEDAKTAKLASMQHFYSSQIGMLKELIAADRSKSAKELRSRVLAQDKASRDLRKKERRLRSRIRKKYLSNQRKQVLEKMPTRHFDTEFQV